MKSKKSYDLCNPLGEPIIDDGLFWTFKCVECNFKHGNFIESLKNCRKKEEQKTDSPLNNPCSNCGGGPVEWHRN